MISVLRWANLALSFLLELAMLVAFAFWGYQAGRTPLERDALSIGLPAIVAVFWAVLMAPKARRRLRGIAYLAVRIVLFGLAVLALASAGSIVPAVVFAGLFAINTVLLHIWEA